MADAELPGRLTQAAFHGPMSEDRAARLVERLARTSPATVLDIGCGWGGLMLRILAAVPGATGVDEHRSFWLRGYRDVLGLAYLTLVPAA